MTGRVPASNVIAVLAYLGGALTGIVVLFSRRVKRGFKTT